MATAFRDWPWPLQALFYLGLAFVIVVAGFYVPGSPVRNVRTDLETAQQSLKPLETEVASLRVYKQRRAELQSEMDALQKQLATLQTIVPEDKQTDQFIYGKACDEQALLLRAAVRNRGGWPVLLRPRLLRQARQAFKDH